MASIRKREPVGENGCRTVTYDATVTRRGARRQNKTFLTKSALTTIDLACYRDARLTDHVRRGSGIEGDGTVDLIRTIAPQTVKHDLGKPCIGWF